MYQLLLCWRYLRTRYIALASIVSVTLGVATMIVVNSVMSGFTTEMRTRIHGILSDVVLRSRSFDGFKNPEWHMERIRQVAGDQIEAMTPTVRVPAMLSFEAGGECFTQPVQLIGIDPATQSQVSDFCKYLQHPENRNGQMSFQLREDNYDTQDHQAGPDAPLREEMALAGWKWRERQAELREFRKRVLESQKAAASAAGPLSSQPTSAAGQSAGRFDPFAGAGSNPDNEFDMATQQHTGLVMGISLAMFRRTVGDNRVEDRFLVLPGDDVRLAVPDTDRPPKPAVGRFTIVDFYQSKMSEYDSTLVFAPIEKVQALRVMSGRVNEIQIKVKPGVDGAEVRDKLRRAFPEHLYMVSTWQDAQGPLLAAVELEITILNVLLFLIIAVAGFGILAIFLMIVVEKTRDIGILKSLGASGAGIRRIFMGYGLSLGMVGSGVGLALGLLFIKYINEIADFLGKLRGRPVFDPEVYYFDKIPTLVDPLTIGWIVFGALAIAVMASILPAIRAARLHPVEALRHE
jgi:lipoprotein-releasing system permease protein